MPTKKRQTKKQTKQSQTFIDTARELGVDESDDPLDRILKRIVKSKPEKKELTDKEGGSG